MPARDVVMKSSLRSYIEQPKGIWSLDQIKAGFEAYVDSYGRYPSAIEIDLFEYLPTSRSIQRSFGGLVKLRKELFPNEISDFTRGEYRSKIASQAFRRAQGYEEIFYGKLCKYLDSISVHEHKVLRPGRVSCDFFIYLNTDMGVCLDLFYAKDKFSARGVIDYKLRHYREVQFPVVFILIGNNTISQDQLNSFLRGKKIKIRNDVRAVTEHTFWHQYIPVLIEKSQYSNTSM